MLLGSDRVILGLPLLQKLGPIQRALFSVQPVLRKIVTRHAVWALDRWFGRCGEARGLSSVNGPYIECMNYSVATSWDALTVNARVLKPFLLWSFLTDIGYLTINFY